MDCEILTGETNVCGSVILKAMIKAAEAAGVTAIVSTQYRGNSPLLMAYGIGHPMRSQWVQMHRRKGGRFIAWDLGYWDRDKAGGGMRLTIDDDHPQKRIRPMPAHRWDARMVPLRNDYHEDGPIVLCGLGQKSRMALGFSGAEWELRTVERLKRYKKVICYRPKKHEALLKGCDFLGVGNIHRVIAGASLVVCRHSNVAVDACIAGIPVECEDGAAFALYGKQSRPTLEQRLDFLRSLAWWNWHPSEALNAWEFIKAELCDSTSVAVDAGSKAMSVSMPSTALPLI